MSKAEEAYKEWHQKEHDRLSAFPKKDWNKDELYTFIELMPDAAFEAGVKWVIEEAKKQKDDPGYKDGGYYVSETLVSLDRLEKLAKE